MVNPRRSLAALLSALVALSAFPTGAAAQVVTGGSAAGGMSGVSGAVPRLELTGQTLAPSVLTPGLSGALSAPALAAPALVPGVVPSAAAIPLLPASALAIAPSAAAVAPLGLGAVQPAKVPAAQKTVLDAKGQLAVAGQKLSAAAAEGKASGSILDSLFTGANQHAADIAGEPVAGVPSALAPTLSAASTPEGKATPPQPITLEKMAIDPAQPMEIRRAAVAALAEVGAQDSLERVADANPQGGALDYEVHRSALRALAERGVVKSLRAVSQEHKEQILASLRGKDKPENAVFDYDDTLAKFREPVSARVAAGLAASSAAGVKTAILTDRPDTKKAATEVTILDSLASMTPAQKSKLTVGSSSGKRLSTFDAAGAQVVVNDIPVAFTEAQKKAVLESSALTAEKFGRQVYGGSEEKLDEFKWVRFLPLGLPVEKVTEAAAFMQARLAERGVVLAVSGRVSANPEKDPPYVALSLLDKTVGMKALADRGFTGKSVIVGDSYFGARNIDQPMSKAAPAGSFTIAVGGQLDPRVDDAFLWPTKGSEASAEILEALGAPKPRSVARRVLDKFLAFVGFHAPVVKAPGADDPVNWKTFGGLVLQRLPSMAAYMLVTIAFVAVAVPVVGWTGYGILMSLSPMAGIAAANIMGSVVKNMSARNAMALNTLLRVVSLMALPTFHFFGVVNMGTLILGALAEGWLLSSIMTTEGSFLKVLFPTKHLGNINGALFQMFPAVQVILGLFLGFGHFADTISPFLVFTGAALTNLLLVLPIIWKTIPNVRLTDAPAALAAPAAKKTPARSLKGLVSAAKSFLTKYWKEAALFGGAIALFAALTWWTPLAASPFLLAHPALRTSLPIAASLAYWVTKTEAFKLMREGKTAEAVAEKDKADAEARPEIYKGRQWLAMKLSSLSTMMYYPLYLIAAPQIATLLAGPEHKGAMIGQFLGALFFGSWISIAARVKLPEIPIPFTGGRKIAAHRIMQGVVSALIGTWMFTKVVPGSILAALAASAVAIGLMAMFGRLTDKGAIKFAGVGFSFVLLPFVVWMWPAAIPFLTIQTAMFIALIAAGLTNGPTAVSLSVYAQRNTSRAESSRVTGIGGSLFNASISAGYALLTIASGFLHPAFPLVLGAMGLVNMLIGAYFWRSTKNLPGLAPTLFTPKAKDAQKK